MTAVALASLLGSLHCVGMCGGFVVVAATPNASARAGGRHGWARHFAYHVGRLVGYVTLGTVAGTIGQAFDLASHQLLGMHRFAALISGVVLLVMAAGYAGLRVPGAGRAVTDLHQLGRGPRTTLSARWFASLLPRATTSSRFALGAATAALPCGWLWSFVLVAAATSTPLLGASTMIAFWAGTVPALMGVSIASGWLANRLRRRTRLVRSATAAALFGLGTLALMGKLGAIDSPDNAACPHHASP